MPFFQVPDLQYNNINNNSKYNWNELWFLTLAGNFKSFVDIKAMESFFHHKKTCEHRPSHHYVVELPKKKVEE